MGRGLHYSTTANSGAWHPLAKPGPKFASNSSTKRKSPATPGNGFFTASLGLMTTINTSSDFYVHCNRCRGGTPHALRGECKQTDNCTDTASGVEIHFAETYSLLQCKVCGQGRLQLVTWNSENDHSEPIFYPAPQLRQPPPWLGDLEQPLQALLKEVYAALNIGAYATAVMGVRSVLDVWVSGKTSNENHFPKKLAALVKIGTLSAQQFIILSDVFDLGSAAIHRAHNPSSSDALAATEALENLLHQDALIRKLFAMKENTPQRDRK